MSQPYLESVELESFGVIQFEGGILLFLEKQAAANRENIQVSSHKTSKRIFRRTHNGFASHVEAGVYDDRTSGDF